MRYMTVKDILDYVDEIKQNSFSRKTKLIWLNELEYRVQTDVMLLAAESITYIPDDDTYTLLVPAPWSEIYYDYILMKLSEHLEESSEQNNRAATFDKAFTRFMRWWADTYRPANGNALFKGYYLKGEDGAFRINVTYSDGVYSADKTFDEIKAAYDAGQQPYVVQTSGASDIVYTLASSYLPSGGAEQGFVSFERYLIFEDTLKTVRLRIFSYTLEDGSNIERQISEFNGAGGGASVELDTTLSEAGKAADAKAVGDALANVAFTDVIDTAKYGITAADYVAPFTAEMYEVAYQNGVGIQNAINDAKANGQRDLVIPAGNYPVCYSGDVDLCNYPIINACGVNLFGYGVKLYVIYDEVGTNPYFTGETPRTLQGTIIVTDSDVRGFHLVGERRYRLHENTKYREGSYGIGLMAYTRGNVIADCICELFSGDGIGGGKHMEQIAGWEDDTFTSVDWNANTSSFVESTKVFTSSAHGGDWIDQTKPLLLRCTGYFLYSSAPLKILCFDANEKLLGTVRFWQGEYFYLLPNTAKWYLQMVREVEHDVTSTETWSYWIGNAYYCDTLIENCKSRFNQRGGMSNLPTNTTVRNCEIHHNGCAYDGMPAFYDGTQFGIDIEDIYIHNISIEGCNIYANTHAVLYRCWGIRFKDCYLQGYVNSLNFCSDFFAENTTFGWSCTMTTPTPFGSKTAIGCKFGGTVAPEINVIGNSVVTASISKVNNTQVEFMDSMGNVLFSLDLSMLGKDFGSEVISKGLLFDGDMTKFTADTLELSDNTGNATIKLSGADKITSYGIHTDDRNHVAVDCTWNNAVSFGNNFTVEFFCIGGVPYIPWRGANRTGNILSWGALGGDYLPYTSNSIFRISNSPGIDALDGDGNVISKTNNGSAHVYNDEGVQTAMKEDNLPGCGIMQFLHYVGVYDEDGNITEYINGYRKCKEFYTSDAFANWDTAPFEAGMNIWTGPNAYYILRAVRVYDRCLSQDEVRNNTLYERNRLGSVWRIAISATNATVDNDNEFFIKENETYTTNVTAKDGYTLSSVVVKMAGEDITATAYSNGVITIPAVTGTVEVIAKADATA